MVDGTNKGWGGKRAGAGRPLDLDPSGQRKAKHSLYCTYYELAMAREFLKHIRANHYKATVEDCMNELYKQVSCEQQTHTRTE